MTKALLIILLYAQILNAQTTIHTVKLGDSIVQIKKQCFSPVTNGTYFINVHSNETTSIETTNTYIEKNGGCFIQLKHRDARNVMYNLGITNFKIDPNRIFTPKGCSATLIKNATLTDSAFKVARALSAEILKMLVEPTLVVAMHNNTNNDFSILSYTKGNKEAVNAQDVFINKLMDIDDFVYTTELKIFNHFKEKNINVILQKKAGYIDDGSLSIYCTKQKIPYVNIEAEMGHTAIQLQMLDALHEIIKDYKTK